MTISHQIKNQNDGLVSAVVPARPERAKSAHSRPNRRRKSNAAPDGAASSKTAISAVQRKEKFQKLDAGIRACGGAVIHTVEQMLPQLNDMWKLLSRKGGKFSTDKDKLPGWTEYIKEIAAEFGLSLRTIQEKLSEFRKCGTTTDHNKKPPVRRSKTWHADAKDSRALAGAQLAINDLIAAYEAGVDMAPAYQQYKKVAVSPAKLSDIVESAKPESNKADVDAEVKKKLVPVVETAERYIRALEALVYSSSVNLTEEQKKTFQKPKEAWRAILRHARGVHMQMTGKGVPIEVAPDAVKEAA
jgi:uncharacterized phage-associated protein